jgi:hypothetical protein
MVIRSWCCLNKNCVHQWDGEGEYPPCPRCGGIRVRWVPKPVAIRSEATKKIDMTVNQLVSTYGDKNYRSPRTHESVAPRVNPVQTPGKTQRFQPAGMAGWAVDMPVDANGQPVSVCAPTGVTAKLPIAADRLGVKAPLSKASPSPTGSVPSYEARHNPPGGVK